MTEMFGEAWPPMSVPDLAPDDDDDDCRQSAHFKTTNDMDPDSKDKASKTSYTAITNKA